jgi:hypothetical protein
MPLLYFFHNRLKVWIILLVTPFLFCILYVMTFPNFQYLDKAHKKYIFLEAFMKRLTGLLFIAVILTGSLYAQNRFSPDFNNQQYDTNSVAVSGTLMLENGSIAVQSVRGNTTSIYLVPILNRYVGFIDGLQEGAAINVEGFSFGNGDVLHPTKITIGGQVYNFPAQDFGHHPRRYHDHHRRDQRPHWR